jgi:hypothetical protein
MKPKGLAAMLISLKPSKSKEVDSSSETDKAIGMVFDALQDGDKEGFINAFKMAHDCCSGEEEPEYEDEE